MGPRRNELKMYDCEIGKYMNAESMNHKVDLSICAVSGCKENIYAEVQVFDQSTAYLCKKHSETYPKGDIIKIL